MFHLLAGLTKKNLLEKEYRKSNASLVIVYGRRRVGKPRLITEFYRDKQLWRFDGVEGLCDLGRVCF